MKKSILAMVVGMSMLIFSGCSAPMRKGSLKNSDDSLNENLVIKDSVNAGFEQALENSRKCDVYTASITSIGENAMNKYFFNEEAQKTVDDENDITFDLGNKHGILSDSSFVFYTDNGNKFDDAVSYYLTDPAASELDNSVDFAFASKETAKAEIIAFLGQVGLKTDGVIFEQACSISKENFDEYKEFLAKTASEESDPKISLQAETVSKIISEDFYYFDIGFSENGIPIYSGKAYYYGEGENDTFVGTRFTIVYTESGIEYVSAFFLYQAENAVETADIISFSDAKELLRNKYENIFFDSPVTFDKAELVYLPFPQNTLNERFKRFVLRPYYAFYGYQIAEMDGETHQSAFTVYLDAITGKEL